MLQIKVNWNGYCQAVLVKSMKESVQKSRCVIGVYSCRIMYVCITRTVKTTWNKLLISTQNKVWTYAL